MWLNVIINIIYQHNGGIITVERHKHIVLTHSIIHIYITIQDNMIEVRSVMIIMNDVLTTIGMSWCNDMMIHRMKCKLNDRYRMNERYSK